MLGHIYQSERVYYAENQIYTGVAAQLVASIPLDTSAENFFTYAVGSTSTSLFTVTATRKTTGGKSPAWTTAYTVVLDQGGSYVVAGF